MELPAKRDPDAFLMLLSTVASPVSGVFCSSVSGTVTTSGCSRHGFKTVLYFCSTDPFSESAVLGLQSFPVLGVFF
jgi:hypothetical protein